MLRHRRNRSGNAGLAGPLCALALIVAGCGGGSADDDDAPECGNAIAEAGEQCDGADLGAENCMTVTQRGGSLGCNADCTFDVSGCTLASCGNGVLEEGESCDGADLGAGTCDGIGYSGGTLACRADCAYEVSGCCTDNCPIDGATMCVGDNLRSCAPAASGCLAWQVTDCAATGDVCDDDPGPAACVCVDRCLADGETRCEGASIETCALQGDGCYGWDLTTDCTPAGEVCAVAPSGPTCVASASAEDCSDPYPLDAGENVVAWTALNADYLVSQPSCNTGTLTGPDVVLAYTAPEDGFITVTMNTVQSARQVLVASGAACGSLEPELACSSATSAATQDVEFAVAAGQTYHLYVRDTTTGTAPLDNPLIVTVQETLCSTIGLAASNLYPPDGASVPDVTPLISADFDYPVDGSAGTITITGTMGTNLSYDLATGPEQVSLINGGKTIVIDPGLVFPEDETLTVVWAGLMDATCAAPIASPAWSFTVTGPPCAPGEDGMVGTAMTVIPATGVSSITEQYVAVDTDPNGYVYVGGTSNLYRVSKAGGAFQNLNTLAGVGTAQLGYDMIVVGSEVYTLDSNLTATTNQLWRITTTGGATWALQNYMQLPMPPNDDLRAVTYYGGRLYMTTDELTDGTEIWSVPAASSLLPEIAVLEANIPLEEYCTGIAVDAQYYYLTCYNDDRVLRVDRVTQEKVVLTQQWDINITKNAVHAHDFDADGITDALYVHSYHEEVYYVCKPAGVGPYFTGVLASFGSGTSNYGLGFDPVEPALWMFDDDTRELVKIE
jgi:hypothetical protein